MENCNLLWGYTDFGAYSLWNVFSALGKAATTYHVVVGRSFLTIHKIDGQRSLTLHSHNAIVWILKITVSQRLINYIIIDWVCLGIPNDALWETLWQISSQKIMLRSIFLLNELKFICSYHSPSSWIAFLSKTSSCAGSEPSSISFWPAAAELGNPSLSLSRNSSSNSTYTQSIHII